MIHAKGTDFAVFMGSPRYRQKPKTYFDPDANANAELSAKFNLILCTSRFAHYLKVMARDKIGSFMETRDCAEWLNDWIQAVSAAIQPAPTTRRRPNIRWPTPRLKSAKWKGDRVGTKLLPICDHTINWKR